MPISKLTTTEAAEYHRCNLTIKSTRGSFVACGAALQLVRDRKLYRIQYKTFEEYCEKEWGWKRRYANRLIEASTVVEEVTKHFGAHGTQNTHETENVNEPQTERASRALSDVPRADRRETMIIAGAGATGPEITLAAKQVADKKVVFDKTGYPVPIKALPYWNRWQEANEILRAISHVRALLKGITSDDTMYVEVNVQGVLMRLHQAYTEFTPAVPYAVCTTCQGVAPEGCSFCKGRGVISKYRFDTCVPEELKELRK